MEGLQAQQYGSHQSRQIIPAPLVNLSRKVYHPLGFKKGYNFFLFFVLCGALAGYTLARFQYLDIDGKLARGAITGDAIYYVRDNYKRVGVILHLAGVLPAALLATFQFVPVIRYKLLLVHRLNGYLVILLFLVGLAGAFMIISSAGGGGYTTQVFLGIFGVLVTVSLILAYVNIKRLRIDLHREWMIRTWVYSGVIISLRLIQLAFVRYIDDHPDRGWYDVQACFSIYQQYQLFGVPASSNPTSLLYPACTSPTSGTLVIVSPNGNGPENATAKFNIGFGCGGIIALAIHAIGVEVYFRFTKAESERLRQVSMERRAEAGHYGKPSVDSETKLVQSDSKYGSL